MTLEERAAIAQDAYHYARAAAGEDSAIDIARHCGPPTRTAALRLAVAKCALAELDVRPPARLRGASRYAAEIRAASAAIGLDAEKGERL